MPDPAKIREHKYVRIFGSSLTHPSLWIFNRRSTAWAFTIGLFCMFIPLPFQMVIAAAFAILLRANIPVSVVLVWITNPITIPPMFYFAYKLGATILDIPSRPFTFELSFEWLFHQIGQIWEPLLLGSFICGIVSAIIGHMIIKILWRIMITRAWLARKRNRQTR